MEENLWQSTASSILTSVKLYYICGVIAAILSISMLSFVPVIGPLGQMASGASVVGAFAFMYGVKRFKSVVDPADAPAVGKLHTSLILIICAIFIEIIPVVGWIVAPIINFVAFIFMLLAYKGMKSSYTMPSPAKEGASKLFVAMIIACVSAIIGIIPIVGTIIAAIIDIVVLIFVIKGWTLIASEQVYPYYDEYGYSEEQAYIEEEYPEDGYAEGEYPEEEYPEEGYPEEGYAEDEYAEGEYAEGEYAEEERY